MREGKVEDFGEPLGGGEEKGREKEEDCGGSRSREGEGLQRVFGWGRDRRRIPECPWMG